jgi:hypothetical protein
MNHKSIFAVVVIFAILHSALAGPITVGACYSLCNAGWVACMSASGLVAGVSPTGVWGWIAWFKGAPVACSAAQSACMTACTVAIVAPTP